MTDQPDSQTTPTEVTISTPGVSVTVKSCAPLDAVASLVEQVHGRAVQRYSDGRLPDGHGGIL